MIKMLQLFDEYVLKAVVMTESILDSDYTDGNKLENFTQNRERLFSVIEKISLEIDWDKVDLGHREELNRKIEYIKVLDVKLLTKLQEYQEQVKKDIEITFKQKENIKGYNLSDVK
jgi:hypothetical protein